MHLCSRRSKVSIPGAAVVRLLVLTLAATVCATAQNENNDAPEPSPPPPSTSAFSLSGVVVNSVTGEPVRRALVQVAGPPLTTATPLTLLTDSEGRFQFSDLPESDITLVARKPGFFSDQELHPENYQPSIVHLGANTPSMVLKLLPEGSISGHVSTTKGDPLEDTPIQVFLQHIIDGRKHWELRLQTTADEDGRFRVANLLPGRYLLAAGPNPFPSAVAARGVHAVREEGIGPLLFPGVPELESATLLSVAAGQQAQADFAVKPEPIFQVTGTVSGAGGFSGGLQLKTRSGESLNWSGTFDPQTGKFRSRITAGSYVLQFRAPDATGRLFGADLPLLVNSDVSGITLIPGPTPMLPIHIDLHPSSPSAQDAPNTNQVPVQNGEVGRAPEQMTFYAPLPCSQVRLIPTETRLVEEPLQAEFFNNPPSSFAVGNLAPGNYSVEMYCSPPWYVQSASSGTTDVLREDLVIAAGRHPDPLEIVVRDDGANLTGSLRVNSEPGPGAVLLIPEQTSPAQSKITRAAPTGEFVFNSVAPGDYKLLGLDSVDGLEFRNPEVLAPYLSKAVHITLQSNEQATATVERISAGK